MPRPKKKNGEQVEQQPPQKKIGPIEYCVFEIHLEGETQLLGGMPKKEQLIYEMMKNKEIRLKAKALGRSVESIVAENLAAMGFSPGKEATDLDEKAAEAADTLESMSCGFRKSPAGNLSLGAHQIPSMLIDCATSLRMTRAVIGIKDLITRNTVCWQEGTGAPVLELISEGEPVPEAQGTLEWGSPVTDRQGTRSILRSYDFIMPWTLRFYLAFPDTNLMTNQMFENLWELSQIHGLGAARPRNFGKFKVVTIRAIKDGSVRPVPQVKIT
jgi:hypothetical protein